MSPWKQREKSGRQERLNEAQALRRPCKPERLLSRVA